MLDAFNEAVARGEPQWVSPHREPAVATGIDHLGSGESYDAYRLRAADVYRVLRVARRPPSALPRSVRHEVDGLALDPTDIAPEPIAFFPDTDNAFGAVAILTSDQRGERLPEDFRWSDDHLEKLARTLARLHARRHDGRGEPVNDAGRSAGLSLLDEFDGSHGWWRTNAPELCAAPDVSAVIGAAREYLVSRRAMFEGLTRLSLVHGDLNQTNLLLDEQGDFVLIDWEWVGIGDPAQDLAFVGGRVSCAPWYAPLSSRALDHLLQAYADSSEHPLDRSALAVRRDCWEVHERLWTGLHFRASGREREAGLLLRGVGAMLTS